MGFSGMLRFGGNNLMEVQEQTASLAERRCVFAPFVRSGFFSACT